MPWVEEEPPCEHPGRPKPVEADEGKIWHCPACDRRWVVAVIRRFREGSDGEDVPHNELLWEPK